MDDIIEADDPDPIIEDISVFPSCTGNREELKACFSKKNTKALK